MRLRALCLAVGSLFLSVSSRGGFDVQFTPQGPVRTETPTAPPVPADPPQEGIVAIPLADLRREPRLVSPQAVSQRPYAVDDQQETQLLFGESVQMFEERDGWIRVEAPEQVEYTHSDRWQGYPGWVLKEAILPRPGSFFPSAVVTARYGRVRQTTKWHSPFMEFPMGSRLWVVYVEKPWARVQGPSGTVGWIRTTELRLDRDVPRKSDGVREAILVAARQFLGEPYYWGGRAGHVKGGANPSGVDCSGLVNVAYRAVALNAPRDAHEQFMAAHPLEKADALRPGDLVFLAKKERSDRIAHVMLFEKGETLIEAVHEFNVVRRVTFKKKFGVRRAALQAGGVAAGYVVRFGSFLEQ
ncbi:MAG: C40 family peptidase [Elusimicrobia bacterium]|nr:C40 family peptidase [Elusimicrobiota bacterium]